MSFEEGGTFSWASGICGSSSLAAKQFFAVTNLTAMVVATAGKACDGILQDNPIVGQAGGVQRSGICKAAISASQALTAGVTMLEVDSGGTLKAVAGGTVVAKAMETLSSVASVQIIAVELLPSNALFA